MSESRVSRRCDAVNKPRSGASARICGTLVGFQPVGRIGCRKFGIARLSVKHNSWSTYGAFLNDAEITIYACGTAEAILSRSQPGDLILCERTEYVGFFKARLSDAAQKAVAASGWFCRHCSNWNRRFTAKAKVEIQDEADVDVREAIATAGKRGELW